MGEGRAQFDLESKIAEFVRRYIGRLAQSGFRAWGRSTAGAMQRAGIPPRRTTGRTRRDAIQAYELHFGDAARGLGTTPHGKRLRWESWFQPA